MTQSAFYKIQNQMICNSSNEEIVPPSSLDSSLINSSPSGNMEHTNMEHTKQNISSDSVSVEGKLVKGTIGREVKLVGDISSLLREVVEERNHLSHPKALSDNVPNASPYNSAVLSDNIREYKYKDSPLFRKILKSDLNSLVAGINRQSDTYGISVFLGAEHKLSCEGMVLIASLLCSCIRSVKQPQLRRAAVLLLKSSSLYIDDDDRLQHVLPYVIAMLSDPAAIVRCAALETLCDILALVRDFPPSDAKIFPEYILPMLSMLPDDPEESVRICYASNVYKIALTAYRFLLRSQSLTEAETFNKLTLSQKEQSLTLESTGKKNGENGDTQLIQLRKSIAEVVHELVMGPKQTPNIRRALLQDIGHLCYFFGQRQSNDFLLPILPAFLNDRDEQLRAAFYGQIVYVCYFVGQRSVEEYLLPYIEQALSDVMEAVIVNALECLAMLCRSGFLRKRILLDMIERAFPLLCYPIQWVRRAAVKFIAESSQSLGSVDSFVYLSPVLRPFLLREPASLSSEMSLLSCLKPPVSKLVFYQVLENARSSDMLERQRKIWYNSTPNSNQWETAEHSRRVPGDLNPTKNIKYAGGTTQKASSQDTEDVSKLRTGSSFTSPNLADVKDSSFVSDKMQFSGFISPQVINGSSTLYEGPSEGIPLYSFPTDKHAGGAVSAGPDSLLHWNSVGVESSCMPWLDPVSNSVESSQVAPPKLVSGSFYDISNSSKLIPRSSKDSDARENRFQDVGVSDTLKGPTSIASDEPPHSDVTGSTSYGRAPSIPDTGWKPRGVLVAHLQEHRSAVNELVVSNDQNFFISTSDDSTVKIWDTRKLEKDISFRSRLTYHLNGSRALCATMLRGMAQVVVGACDGTLHMFSVDYISRGLGSVVERYSGIADIKKKEIGEGAILSLLNCSASDSSISQTILYSTLRCGIHLWDTRANSVTWNFRAIPEEGYISSLVMGQCGNWFVSGSSRGVLTLWDLRFLLPVNSWKYSTVCPIERMCLFIPPSNAISAMPRPLVYVAAGCNEVSLWNAESGSCHQVYGFFHSKKKGQQQTNPTLDLYANYRNRLETIAFLRWGVFLMGLLWLKRVCAL